MGTHEPSIPPSLSGCVWKHAPESAVVLSHHLPSTGRFSAGARSPAWGWKCDLAMALMSRPKCAQLTGWSLVPIDCNCGAELGLD